MDKTILADVHRCWFGDLANPPPWRELQKRWFEPTPEIDAHIRDTFGRHLDPAAATDWNLATLSAEQQVGLIVLLDQFPRQSFREDARAFAYDAKVLGIARALVVDDGWRRFHPVEQIFVFLPFEHSEEVADQDLSVLLFAEAVQAAPVAAVQGARTALDLATKHRDIIRRFGRFPHRNAVLGRASTPEETEFLKAGRGF